MAAYLFRRLLLVVPTLFGIIAINFFVVQLAPGGPVEQAQGAGRRFERRRRVVPSAERADHERAESDGT